MATNDSTNPVTLIVEGLPKATSDPTNPVTLIVVPRERASVAYDSLRSIYDNTPRPFELIYVDCLLSGRVQRQVRELLAAEGHTYLRSRSFLRPNQARNIGVRQATGRNLVFIDNDIFVEPGWLEQLLSCAEETGAGVVGPLYLEGDLDDQHVHCAGGEIELVEAADGKKTLIARQEDLGLPVSELPQLQRTKTGLVEFHCVLITRECLEAIGGTFDEGLLTTREHVDLCLLAEKADFDVYLEPDSRVGYGNEEPITLPDLRYFLFRWSEGATRSTIAHFEAKWDVRLDPERLRIMRERRARAVNEVASRYRMSGLLRAGNKVRRKVYAPEHASQ